MWFLRPNNNHTYTTITIFFHFQSSHNIFKQVILKIYIFLSQWPLTGLFFHWLSHLKQFKQIMTNLLTGKCHAVLLSRLYISHKERNIVQFAGDNSYLSASLISAIYEFLNLDRCDLIYLWVINCVYVIELEDWWPFYIKDRSQPNLIAYAYGGGITWYWQWVILTTL
jgi:hypothetical protein